MREAERSTPAQPEKTEKGLPVPVGFIAFLAIIAIAAIFGPPLIAGMGESGTPSQTTNPGASNAEIETVILEEDEDPEKESEVSSEDITEILEPTPTADGIVGQRYEDRVPSIFEDPETHSIFITDVSVKNEMVKLTIKNYHRKLSYECAAVGVNPLEREVFLPAGKNFILEPGEEVTLQEKIVSQPWSEIQYNTVAMVTLRGGLFLPR